MSYNVGDMSGNMMPDSNQEVPEGGRSRRGRDRQWNRGQREGRGHGDRQRGEFTPRKTDPIKENLANLSGPTTQLETKDGGKPKKFTGRCRLFVGNLPNSMTEEDFKNLFKPYGETAELFLNPSKGFGFVKLDTKQNAETAKQALDFSVKDGKALRVRFATQNAALKVKNLSPWVSNELLEVAFSVFGEVERAVVIVDDRGRSMGEGIVEYARRPSAQTALKKCSEGCFMLTSSPTPVIVEPLEQRDEEDGLPEKNFQKNNKEYLKERDIGPRLAEPGTFEYDFATRWKQLYEIEKQKREYLEREIMEARHRLDEQVEFAKHEFETMALRQKLQHMEEQSNAFQRQWGMRREVDRHWGEQRRPDDMMMNQRQDVPNRGGADDILRMQANYLSGLLDRQEAALSQMQGSRPQNMNENYSMGGMNQEMQRGPPGNAGMGGPGGMGIPPQREFQFEQPYMDGPEGSAPGNNDNMQGNGSAGKRNPREMMDEGHEFPAEGKRRRY